MRYLNRLTATFALLSASAILLAGCDQGVDVEDTAEQSAREALGVDGDGTERTVETQRDVIVQDTTQVIDAQTGEVIKTEETQTPVTITQEKTVERDVDVDTGESTTIIE